MWEAIKDNSIEKSKFTEKQLKQLEAGAERIEGYTWHHNGQSAPNNMQLIPKYIHSNTKVPHTGQNSLQHGD